jgi:hypothetical protein
MPEPPLAPTKIILRTAAALALAQPIHGAPLAASHPSLPSAKFPA